MLSLLTLAIEFLLLNIMPISMKTDILVTLLILAFSVSFMFEISKSSQFKGVVGPIFIAYFMRIFLLFFDLYGRNIFQLPNSGADTEWFYNMGLLQAEGRVDSSEMIIKLTGVAVNFLGNLRLYLQFLLLLCSIIAILVANLIMQEVGLEIKKRRTTLYLLGMLPNYAILSSIFLRESIVTMFVTISMYFFVRWWKGKHEGNFWISFLFVFFASSFHSGAIGVAIGYILVRFVYNRKSKRIKMTLSTMIPALLFLFVFFYLYNNYAELLFGKMLNIENINDIAQENVVGGSSYASYAGNSNSILNMIIYTPIRMIMFQFSPFIWQIRGINDIIAVLFDSFYFMYVVYKTFRYIRIKEAENKTLVILLLVIVFSTTFIFGWGVTNTGTALRHRNKMAVAYALLLGLTMKPIHIKSKN